MAKIKGSAIINRLKFIDENGSPEQKAKIISKLDPEFQENIRVSILTISWYPIEFYVQLSKASDEVLGKGDTAIYEKMGYYSGEQGSRGLYKFFFKIGSPEFIIKRSPNFWNQIMDSGKCYSEITGDKAGLIGIRDFEIEVPTELCLGLKGWALALLEQSGAKNVKINYSKKPSPGFHGIEFSFTWT